MWSIIFLILGVFILIISRAVLGSCKTPVTFFSVLWCIVAGIANMCLYGYYAPSDVVNIIILIGVIIFTFVYGVSVQRMPKAFFVMELEFDDDNINWKLLLTVNIVAIFILVPTLRQSLVLLQGDGLAYLRANSTSVYSSGILAVLNDSVIRPLFVTTTIMSCVYLFTKNNRKNKVLFILHLYFCYLEVAVFVDC